jgi:hypothetical protein
MYFSHHFVLILYISNDLQCVPNNSVTSNVVTEREMFVNLMVMFVLIHSRAELLEHIIVKMQMLFRSHIFMQSFRYII